jgi:hypothetical protein
MCFSTLYAVSAPRYLLNGMIIEVCSNELREGSAFEMLRGALMSLNKALMTLVLRRRRNSLLSVITHYCAIYPIKR